ncbi:EAL domain-containing protein [Cellulomonas sp. KRMCY2]|uniref:EAL and HDOD domain-containing protein n=1 Tax=Cellulomonas sp. KRMCY2 TaxID=1304865 RepID=UPI0004BB4AA1
MHGYEFLYRAGREHTLRVDRWSAAAQDRATLRVLEATFSGTGVQSVAAHALVFVSLTRSLLVSDLPVPPRPGHLVIEVVESVRADAAVVRGVATLRAQGFRIAIDDFVGLDSQLPLLPYADYVTIDRRDLVRGPALVDLARTYGATLVAERIETAAEWERCRALGFDLFQGNHLEATQVLNRTPIMSRRPVARSWTPKTVGGTTSSARTAASTAATIPSPRAPVAR